MEAGTRLSCGWTVGPLVGSGDCGEVYEATRGGEVSAVVKVAKLTDSNKKKKKEQERRANTLFQEHLVYEQVGKRFPQYFPLKLAYGEEFGCRYLVLRRLGRGVRAGDEPTYVAEMVRALEALHASGYAYSDMKPENIMLGFFNDKDDKDDKDDKRCPSSRLVDFGLAQRFRSALTGSQRDAPAADVGAQRYRGVESQRRSLPPSRQSDLEALAHVALCLSNGDSLPWDGLDRSAFVAKKVALADPKATVDACRGVASHLRGPLTDFLAACRSISHGGDPDYDRLETLAKKLVVVKGAKRPRREEGPSLPGAAPGAADVAIPPRKRKKKDTKVVSKVAAKVADDEKNSLRRSPRRQSDRERRAAKRAEEKSQTNLKPTSREALLAKARKQR